MKVITVQMLPIIMMMYKLIKMINYQQLKTVIKILQSQIQVISKLKMKKLNKL
jgi:hypothetical protein